VEETKQRFGYYLLPAQNNSNPAVSAQFEAWLTSKLQEIKEAAEIAGKRYGYEVGVSDEGDRRVERNREAIEEAQAIANQEGRGAALNEAIAAVDLVKDLKGNRNFPGENPTPGYDRGVEDAIESAKANIQALIADGK
jgi:hypothetical protein